MFGLRNRRRPRAAARSGSAIRSAVPPVVAECLEQRLVLSAVVSVWVESIQSTAEATPQQAPGKFRFHAEACSGSGAPASVTVTFQLSGTASSGGQCGGSGDYTGDLLSGTVDVPVNGAADVTFDAVDDQEVEGEETVLVTLDDGGEAYSVPAEGFTGRAAAASIADNDVNVWVEATDNLAKENGQDPGVFTIHRDGRLSDAIAVYYTLGGSATAGTEDAEGAVTPDDADYIAPSPEPGESYRKVIIPAGQTTVTVSIAPLNDALVESDETVELTLVADQSPDGPFYNAPGDAGPPTDLVHIRNLEVRSVTLPSDPDAPDPSTLNDDFVKLGFENEAVWKPAKQRLADVLRAHTSLEPYFEDRAANGPDPAANVRVQTILREVLPLKASLDTEDGKYKLAMTLRPPADAATRYVVSIALGNVDDGNKLTFKIDPPGEVGAQRVTTAANSNEVPNVFNLIPRVETDVIITVSVREETLVNGEWVAAASASSRQYVVRNSEPSEL